MNITTFYSFKGGVGRTLALANVAHYLASKGSRVLVVDFDLEAPGLDSIFPRSASSETPGLVEYVCGYLAGSEPPDVREFVYEWGEDGDDSNPILVMPAGVTNDSYSRRLGMIDWVDLYERQQGFLLFQDLKAQWEKKLDVDYVLIDSRTGHSDVAGICTRQLPDTLVVLFFPNDETLSGLTRVVGDVRSEPELTGRAKIEIIFVASNIPRLDDEESILRRRMELFSTRLETGPIGRVHRYDSLDLLERPLFTGHRPGTRLAKEFRAIADKLRMANAEDRDGAIRWLEHSRRTGEPAAVEKRLSLIEEAHSADGEVLFGIGNARVLLGQFPEGAAAHGQAIETGYARPQVYLALAETLQRLGDFEKAAEAATAVLHDSSTTPTTLRRVVGLLRLAQPDLLTKLVGSQAVNDLPHDDRIDLAIQLDRNVGEREIAYDLLEPLLQRAAGREEWYSPARFAFGCAALALGRFAESDEAFRAAVAADSDNLASAFNLAMSRWALTSAPDSALFNRVLENSAAQAQTERPTPNFLQCMALASHLAGRGEEAENLIKASRRAIRRQPRYEFSCWQYLQVSRLQFLQDLDEMISWMGGEAVVPKFFGAAAQLDFPEPFEGTEVTQN